MSKQRSLWKRFVSPKIAGQIGQGFMWMIIIFLSTAGLNLYTILNSYYDVQNSAQNVEPSKDVIEDFRTLVLESKLHSIGFVYREDTREEERSNIEKLHNQYDINTKNEINQLVGKWKNEKHKATIKTAMTEFSELVGAQIALIAEVKEILATDRVSRMDLKKELQDIVDQADNILRHLADLSKEKKAETTLIQKQLLRDFGRLVSITAILSILVILFGIFISVRTTNRIIKPIKYINKIFLKLGTGELPEDQNYKFRNDEIGEMADSVDKIVRNLKELSFFAQEIGKENYEATYNPLSERDLLGNALLDMSSNLTKSAKEDEQRTWANEGLVKFANILKSSDKSLEEISSDLISELVKYVGANQGGVFIVENEENEAKEQIDFMVLKSCYAWDKQKYLNQKILPGDGLAGQSWKEQNTIYITEVPENYVQITSGMGGATPNAILIVPMETNDNVYGVLELATFGEFESYKIEFVENIAETMASTVSAIKSKERQQRLLEESDTMAEQMRSQKEEMLQNMEELQAATDSMERSQKEAQERETLINTVNLVIETNRKFLIKSINELAEAKLNYDVLEFDSMAIEYLIESPEKVKEAKDTLTRGYKWSDVVYIKGKEDIRLLVKLSAAPIKNEAGRVTKYLFLMDDITDIKLT